jgi:hypothetical protein
MGFFLLLIFADVVVPGLVLAALERQTLDGDEGRQTLPEDRTYTALWFWQLQVSATLCSACSAGVVNSGARQAADKTRES